MPKLSLAALAENAAVWHADELAGAVGPVLATGHAALDAQLPGGGWPVGALVEILQAQSGQNEWRLLLPALARSRPGPVVLVGAPHTPFGPGLSAQGLAFERLLWIRTAEPASRMWACEQALRCADVVAVLAWLPQARPEQLHRLQIAAAEGAKLLFVMRPAQARCQSSPAALRLLASMQPGSDDLLLDIFKRRGPPLTRPLCLPARGPRLAALVWRQPGRAGHKPAQRAPAITAAAASMLEPGDALDSTASAS